MGLATLLWLMVAMASVGLADGGGLQPAAALDAQAKPKPNKSKSTPTPAPPPLLEGVVQGPDAKPIKDARVSYRGHALGRNDTTSVVRTDAEGRFRVTLTMRSPHTVRVEAVGFAGQTLQKVQPGSPLLVRLAPGRRIEGRVTDASAAPIAKARVIAGGEDILPVSWWEESSSPQGTTDAEGRFRLENVGPSLQRVEVTARGYAVARRTAVRAGTTVDFVLRPGSGLSGSVLDAEGRPVEGARVLAMAETDSARRTASSQGDGRFDLPGLEPGRYTLIARHASFAPSVLSGVSIEPDSSAEATLSLAAGVALSGRLVGSDERPRSGQVLLQELAGQVVSHTVGEVVRAAAGADGRFRLENIPTGASVFLVSSPGLVNRRLELDFSARETVVDLGDIVLEAGLSIRGRVRSTSGAPIADAQVWAHSQGRSSNVETRAESDGSFLIGGLASEPYRVGAHAPGFSMSPGRAAVPGSDTIEISLSPAGSLTGTVVDERGQPCDTYYVTAHSSKGGGWDTGMQNNVVSLDGRFQLEDLAEGSYVLQVIAPDHPPATVSNLAVVPGRTTDVGVVRLTRGGIVKGLVTETSGAPVAGATVVVDEPGLESATWQGGLESIADPSGAFEIRGVPSGRRTLAARHPDYAGASTSVEVDPSRDTAEARLTLTKGGRIEGVLRGRDGAGKAGFRVQASSTSGGRGWQGPPRATETQADGAFALDHLPPGPTQVIVLSPQKSGRFAGGLRRLVEVREGEVATLDITLREILVSGRVTRRGAPLPGILLRLGLHRGGGGAYGGPVPADTGPHRLVAQTRDDGTYELIVDEPGAYRVMAQAPDGRVRLAARETQVPDVDRFGLDLDYEGVPVTGVVVDAETGAPMTEAWVSASSAVRRGAGGARTDADGSFELDLDPGEYKLSTGAEAYLTSDQPLSVGTAGVAQVRLTLKRGLDISGRITGRDGRPAASVEVFATREAGGEFAMAQSLPDGTFRLEGLRAQTYILSAGSSSLGYGIQAGVKGGEREANIRLRPGGRVALVVRRRDGSPAVQALVFVEHVGGIPARFFGEDVRRTDSTGRAEISAPAGDVEIGAELDTGEGTVRVTVAEGIVADAEIVLTEPIDR
jgi:hypothetical protein